MKTPISKQNDINIFILHLIHRINRPMTYVELNEIVQVTEHVQYIDFAEAFPKMIENGYIDPVGKNLEDDEMYFVTKKGIQYGENIKSEFRDAILRESTAAALRFLHFTKDKGLSCNCEIHRNEEDKTFDVTFTIRNYGREVLRTTINVESEFQARQISRNCYANPDVVLSGMTALLSGDINYIWEVGESPAENPIT